MRIVIVTDSLGLPRESCNQELTWVEEFLKLQNGNVVYTFLEGGKSSADLIRHPINKLNPDLIIVQVGIVDAVRRATGKNYLKVVSRIPIINRTHSLITKRYHLLITKLFNIHYVNFNLFLNNIKNFVRMNNQAKIVFLSIAPAGKYLVDNTYRVKEDIELYNSALRDSKADVINPFEDVQEIDDFLLKDGHHLNELGHKLVFESVIYYYRNLINMS